MEKLYFLILLNCIALKGLCQTDREYWFAAPEVSASHGDKPLYLRVSTFDTPANIVIDIPANKLVAPITVAIPALSTRTINLTTWVEFLENKPDNTVLNKGMHIVSSADITAYYEVYGSTTGQGNNSEIFALKGSRALGFDFFIPMQNFWNNNLTVSAWSSFDIVATEDNTIVTILPTQNIAGNHPAGVEFKITLQRGQTYSARSEEATGRLHPSGSQVRSNNPIAITYKDDSLLEGMHWDLIGDQIIPVPVVGSEYIAAKISGFSNIDKVFVCATQDSCDIFINGDSLPVGRINKGQTYVLWLSTPSVYIKTTMPSYALHVGGFTQELGAALLPPLGCTGSSQVSFTRSNSEDLYLELLTKASNENGFLINGKKNDEIDSAFHDVPGSNGVWKMAKVYCDPLSIPEGIASIVSNTKGDFHLATWNGGPSTGFRYGYFSDFSFFRINTQHSICPGSRLSLDAGFGKSSYKWYYLPDTNVISSTRILAIADSGVYRIQVSKDTCYFREDIIVKHFPSIIGPLLPPDTSLCTGEVWKVSALSPHFSYLWNNGADQRTISVSSQGNYVLKATNQYGCSFADSLYVSLLPLPQPAISIQSDFEEFCRDSIVVATSTQAYKRYQWNTGDTTFSIKTYHSYPDLLSLQVTDSLGCKSQTSLEIDCSTYVGNIPNLLTPNNDNLNENLTIPYLQVGSFSLSIYNRWGSLVYFDENYDNRWNPKENSDGIYFYLLHHKQGKKDIKGWVQVVR